MSKLDFDQFLDEDEYIKLINEKLEEASNMDRCDNCHYRFPTSPSSTKGKEPNQNAFTRHTVKYYQPRSKNRSSKDDR